VIEREFGEAGNPFLKDDQLLAPKTSGP